MKIVEYHVPNMVGVLRGVEIEKAEKKVRIINLLGTELCIVDDEGNKIYIPSSDITVTNLYCSHGDNKSLVGIPIKRQRYCGTINIPEPELDTYYVVPNDIKTFFSERDDFLTVEPPSFSNEIRVNHLIA